MTRKFDLYNSPGKNARVSHNSVRHGAPKTMVSLSYSRLELHFLGKTLCSVAL